MKSDAAQVTVFIPTFNRLRELQRAVASVRRQGNFVHLHVLDNASTDGTGEWLKELAHEMSSLELTLREKNEGALQSFAEGFDRVRTPYVVPLADDDEVAPGFIESALRIAAEETDLGAVIFKTESRRDGETLEWSPPDAKPGRREPGEHLIEWAEHGHYVSWSSILWRTESFTRIRPADQLQRFGMISDVWMQFLVFADCAVFLVDQPGSIFHIHAEQWSRQIGPESILPVGRMVREMDRVLGESGALNVEERRVFLSNVCLRFNAMVGHQCRQAENLMDDVSLRRWLDAYLELIYPHAGFAKFPLLPLFEEFRSMTKALDVAGAALHEQDVRLQELQERSDMMDAIEHSLRWRISSPLALLERAIRKLNRHPTSRQV